MTGVITDPRTFDTVVPTLVPESFPICDNMVVAPAAEGEEVEVVRGPNIKPFPVNKPLAEELKGQVLIKVEDNITTDHIMPSNAKLLPYRSNIPYLSEYCLTPCDPEFPANAMAKGGGFIVGGANYGQGSSREHAALAPLYLGIKAVIAKSFARIHAANLINNGIIPLVFADEQDYDKITKDDELYIPDVRSQVKSAMEGKPFTIVNKTKDYSFEAYANISSRQADMLLAGGLLNYTRNN